MAAPKKNTNTATTKAAIATALAKKSSKSADTDMTKYAALPGLEEQYAAVGVPYPGTSAAAAPESKYATLPGIEEQYAAVGVPYPGNPTALSTAIAQQPDQYEASVVDPGGQVAAAQAQAQQPTDEEYLGTDSTYLATQAALSQALSNYGTEIDSQKNAYDQDYNTRVDRMGYRNGQWDYSDANTDSGKAYQNQQNDFAARGMLQSSSYATANQNLGRDLDNQLANAATSRASYQQGLESQRRAYSDDSQNQSMNAKLQALARKSSKYASLAGSVVS